MSEVGIQPKVLEGPEGPPGPQGPKGEKGEKGETGFWKTVAEFEATLFKKILVETLEKIKKIAGELLEITGISALRGIGYSTGAEITKFELILAKTIRAAPGVLGGGRLVFGASESNEELPTIKVDNYKPTAPANLLLFTCKEAGTTKLTGINAGFEVNGNPLFIFNNNATGSGKNITPVIESLSSEENHRFAGVEKTLEPQQCAIFIFAENRWRRIV